MCIRDRNKDNLKSYLLDITEDILEKKENKEWLLDKVLDVAKQKGTGKWTARVSLEYGVPVPSLLEAVEARFLSAMKEERIAAQECCNSEEVLCKGNASLTDSCLLYTSGLQPDSNWLYDAYRMYD